MTEKTDKNATSCKDVLDYICTHFGEDDDSDRCRQVHEHLIHCPDCESFYKSMDKMVGLYRVSSPCFSEEAKKMLLESLGIDDKD